MELCRVVEEQTGVLWTDCGRKTAGWKAHLAWLNGLDETANQSAGPGIQRRL